MTTVPDTAALTEIWRTVLHDPDVGPDTSFFDAGGTSLTAVRLRAHIEGAYGLDVDVLAIVDNPSPEALSLALEGAEP